LPWRKFILSTSEPRSRQFCPLCGATSAAPWQVAYGRPYQRCGQCHLTFLEPSHLPSRAAEKAEYDLHENDPADPGYRRFLAKLLDRMLPLIEPGSQGLDFGCGPGPAIATILREQGHHMVNYDPVYVPDRDCLSRQYDFVTCTEAVEHFHVPARDFAILQRLLKPGALLGLMTQPLTGDTDFPNWWYAREISHVSFYAPETFEWLASWLGWKLVMAEQSVWIFRKL
jgi:ribosomal protein S27AE